MDESAISKIRDVILTGVDIDTDIPVVALPSDMSIHALEQFMKSPARFRGAFTTQNIASFHDYIARHINRSRPVVFVDRDRMSARAVFDFGSIDEPGWCNHEAVLNCTKTPEIQALEVLVDSGPHGQVSFAEWLEDWADCLSAVTASGDQIPVKKAINAVRHLTIESAAKVDLVAEDMVSERSSLERVEASGRDGLPAFIQMKASPYVGLQERSLVVRVSVSVGSSDPLFSFRPVQAEKVRDEIAQEFLRLISAQVGDFVDDLFIGEFIS